jgi:hypothetical protein
MESLEPKGLDQTKFWWEVLKFVVIGVAAVFSFFANRQSASNANALAQLKVESDRAIQQARLETERATQQAQIDLRIYELVEKAVSGDGPEARGRGVAAAALINSLTAPPLRAGLLNALRAGTKDETLIKLLDAAQEFDEVQAGGRAGAATTPRAQSRNIQPFDGSGRSLLDDVFPSLHAQSLPGPLKGLRVDILYCEDRTAAVTDARRKRAEQAENLLKPVAADVAVRVRSLPTLIQARPEYRSASDEIRHSDQPADRDAAAFLAKQIRINPENVRKGDGQTTGALSVFYCGQ